jgi:formamidopyrimidine-DNA glycosylase
MPELPEVETHVRDLQVLVGRQIVRFASTVPKALSPSYRTFARQIAGCKILALSRRAKYLIFTLSGGLTLVAHFRMTGHFLLPVAGETLGQTVRHIFYLDRGELWFDDIRKFGTLTLCGSHEYEGVCRLARLGPEPLEQSFTLAALRQQLAGKSGKLKAVLLDQTVVAGIGNIYADEICFTAGLHPELPASQLTPAQLVDLHRTIRSELAKGVRNRGTTVGEFVDSRGQSGGNQHTLRAYKRHGLPCKVCGTTMAKLTVSQRTTTYCPKCQKLPKAKK